MVDDAPLIALRGIRKSFDGVEVLHGVDFDLRAGEIHGLLGQNGAGKSTLMKLVDGVYGMDEGEVLVRGRAVSFDSPRAARAVGIGMVFQEFSLVPTLTVAQNLFLTREPTRLGIIDDRECSERARDILARLGIDIDPATILTELAVGDRQIIEIAKTLLHEPSILILDEPTASLSHTEIDRLFNVLRVLRQRGIGVIYISHHLQEILQLCDRATILRDGGVTFSGRMEGVTLSELVKAVTGEPRTETQPTMRGPRGVMRTLLEVDRLDVGDRVHQVSLKVAGGEVVGIAGLLGSGRSELLEALFGARAHRGTISWKGRPFRLHSPADATAQGIALVPEDRRRQGLVAEHSVRDNMLLPGWSRVSRFGLIIEQAADRVLQRFVDELQIRLRDGDQSVVSLSGGNQQKVVLAKFLAVEPQLLMLDEPTAGIDVGTKKQILEQVRALAAGGCAVIFVSSDLQEVAEVSNRIIVMHRGRIVSEIDCSGQPPSESELMAVIQGAATSGHDALSKGDSIGAARVS